MVLCFVMAFVIFVAIAFVCNVMSDAGYPDYWDAMYGPQRRAALTAAPQTEGE